jgi:hypothetical protein
LLISIYIFESGAKCYGGGTGSQARKQKTNEKENRKFLRRLGRHHRPLWQGFELGRISRQRFQIFFADGFVEFFPKNTHSGRAFDAKTDLPTLDLHKDDSNIFAETYGFIFFSGQYEHGAFLG